MKQQEILEGNKLIALFMGAIYSENAEAWGFGNAHIWSKKIKLQGKVYKNLVWATKFEKELKYHSSWDWLMPCFNKLREYQCSYKISEEYCEIKSWIGQFAVECVYENTIEAAYNCMIKFIKWYNENKNK